MTLHDRAGCPGQWVPIGAVYEDGTEAPLDRCTTCTALVIRTPHPEATRQEVSRLRASLRILDKRAWEAQADGTLSDAHRQAMKNIRVFIEAALNPGAQA